MRRLTTVMGMVVLGFLLFSNCLWAEWYPGITHDHSTFSDGSRNPETLIKAAKRAGVSFLIVTDHYEQIESPYNIFNGEKKKGATFADDYGFDNYRDRFSKLASSDFVIITGAEITTYWNDAASHLLVFGDLARDEDLMKWHGQKDTQQAVTNRVNELGLLSVAAHPSQVSQRIRPWESSNLQFDPSVKTGLKGIEFFNDETVGDYRRTRDLWYLMRLGWGQEIFVTSGCDSHGWGDPFDSERWTKKTWVWSEKLDKESLLQAMGQGRTYAANYGASFEVLNYIPGFQAPEQEVDRARFLFTVKFEDKVKSDKTVRIYRDGNLIHESVPPVLAHTINLLNGFYYDWEDKGIEGEHQYTIEVEGVLITSPIRLKIRTSVPPIAIIEGKYFSQEYPGDYLELRGGRTATWDCHYDMPPEDVRWKLNDNKDGLYIYSRTESRWKREFLIKGNGVIVRSIDGTAWVKEGVRYSFSPEEVSGIYRADTKKLPPILPRYNVEVEVTQKCWPPERLVLRPDGICTYTKEPIIAAGIKVMGEGSWKIDGNRILAELTLLGRQRDFIFRVFDRDTLTQDNWPGFGYTDWIREKVGAK